MKEPLKVVLIGTAYPLRGGLAAFNERLIREYRKNGAQAYIYTFKLQYPSFLFPGKTQLSSEPAPANLPIYVKVNSINPFNWIRVGRELRRQNPDLVLAKYWMPFMAPCFGTIVRLIRKNKHSRIISILDNVIPHERRIGDKLLSKFWVRSTDGFVAMSRSVMDDLHSLSPAAPCIYCPHPIYDHYGNPVPKQQALKTLGLDAAFHYVLFFGFIREYKGLDLLLEAFADPRLSKKNIKLLVAGEFYDNPQRYHDIITRLHLKERVILSNDFIPDSKVVNYFCAADLVVQPYKSATQSGVTQIAYHFGKPMIITRVGGLAEFVPDGKVGYVTEPEPEAIASAMVQFYDEEREHEFSKNALLEKEKYSWERMTLAIAEAAGKKP